MDIIWAITQQAGEWFEERGRSFVCSSNQTTPERYYWEIHSGNFHIIRILAEYIPRNGALQVSFYTAHVGLIEFEYEIADPAFPEDMLRNLECIIQEDMQNIAEETAPLNPGRYTNSPTTSPKKP